MNKNQVFNTFHKRALQAALRKWWNLELQHFTHPIALTLTLKQCIRVSEGFVKIDKIAASRNVSHFLNRVNKRVYGTSSRRHGKRLSCLPVVEHDEVHRMHYHLLLDRPGRYTDAEFEALIRECWQKTAWSDKQIYYQADADEGWISYITKHSTKSDFDESIDLGNCNLPRTAE